VKEVLENINRVFESKARLGIMSVLLVNEKIDFNSLKSLLGLTDGNLASHISALEKNRYIKINKTFIGKKPNTSYSVTANGRRAFKEHLDALERLISGNTL
jgi:DNA-binding MarR family transcriptional regulator